MSRAETEPFLGSTQTRLAWEIEFEIEHEILKPISAQYPRSRLIIKYLIIRRNIYLIKFNYTKNIL